MSKLKKFWQRNKEILKFIGIIFLIWQFFLTVLSAVSLCFLSPKNNAFVYFLQKPSLSTVRANFDGIHYLGISERGYGLYQQAFFPLYPFLVGKLSLFLKINHLYSGILISNISLFIFLFVFYKLISLDLGSSIAKRTLIIFLAFPISFFLGAVYTESLFLALAVGSFYSARKNKWLLAGTLGALASCTRVTGVFLFPALFFEWYQQNKIKNLKLKIKNCLPLSLIPLGLGYYMHYLWKNYNDPLMFVHVQPFFGAGRSGGKAILLYQVFWRYLKMVLTTRLDPLYFIVWLEFLTGIAFLVLLFFAFKKKIRLSYLVFAVLAYFLPTLSGTLSSFPRYALTLFPCFIVLGTVKNKIIRVFLVAIFGILSIISATFFFRGYWVS